MQCNPYSEYVWYHRQLAKGYLLEWHQKPSGCQSTERCCYRFTVHLLVSIRKKITWKWYMVFAFFFFATYNMKFFILHLLGFIIITSIVLNGVTCVICRIWRGLMVLSPILVAYHDLVNEQSSKQGVSMYSNCLTRDAVGGYLKKCYSNPGMYYFPLFQDNEIF